MKLLITGFDPFDNEATNPSWEVVKDLPEEIKNIKLIKKELPTEFIKAQKLLEKYILEYQPDYIISVGQAGGITDIQLEKVAINLMNARIPDNASYQPKNEPVVESGPVAYFSELPLDDMKDAIIKANIPAKITYSAGTFVCNTVFYKASNLIEENNFDTKACFIHVPYLPEQAIGKEIIPASMGKEIIKEALIKAIEVLGS